MKKAVSIFLFVIIISALTPIIAWADAGPKPSVTIEFKGLDNVDYYATLLSSTESYGPNRAGDPYQQYMGSYEAYLRFTEYEDTDGFYFISYYEDCSKTNKFRWTYYPPEKFKVLLYFPDTDTFVVSDEIYERYAFDSYFRAEVTEQGGDMPAHTSITMSKSYRFVTETISLIIRIILTIAIELGIAWLFGLREKKIFRFIAIVNIVTQIALNLALNTINYHWGGLAFFFFYILLELSVFGLEALIYTIQLTPEVRKGRLILYAFSANLASFFVGLILAVFIPFIF